MSVGEFRYEMTVTIVIEGDHAKWASERDKIIALLQSEKNAGNLNEAEWKMPGASLKPEGGTI